MAGKRGKAALTKKALITGLTGQDGAYLLRLLLDKDYEVHAIIDVLDGTY